MGVAVRSRGRVAAHTQKRRRQQRALGSCSRARSGSKIGSWMWTGLILILGE
jgi:hypothetical protein